MDSKKNRQFYFIGLATLFLLILLDQLTKYAAVRFLKGNSSISILPGILELYYLENLLVLESIKPLPKKI